MLTVNKLSVTDLSAISANIGTVTAGNITGVNITGSVVTGGGVTVKNDGITLPAGQNIENRVKWTNGGFLESYGSAGGTITRVHGDGAIYLTHAGGVGGVLADASGVRPFSSDVASLGGSGSRWHSLHLGVALYWNNPPTTTYQDQPLVWSVGNSQVYRRVDAVGDWQGTPGFIHVRGGLVVDVF